MLRILQLPNRYTGYREYLRLFIRTTSLTQVSKQSIKRCPFHEPLSRSDLDEFTGSNARSS